jgi:hypothetical protein
MPQPLPLRALLSEAAPRWACLQAAFALEPRCGQTRTPVALAHLLHRMQAGSRQHRPCFFEELPLGVEDIQQAREGRQQSLDRGASAAEGAPGRLLAGPPALLALALAAFLEASHPASRSELLQGLPGVLQLEPLPLPLPLALNLRPHRALQQWLPQAPASAARHRRQPAAEGDAALARLGAARALQNGPASQRLGLPLEQAVARLLHQPGWQARGPL